MINWNKIFMVLNKQKKNLPLIFYLIFVKCNVPRFKHINHVLTLHYLVKRKFMLVLMAKSEKFMI